MKNIEKLKTGVLPIQEIKKALDSSIIQSQISIDDNQLQPASLDLRLGKRAWRLQASFLPGKKYKVIEKIHKFALHELNLKGGAVLEKGCVYLVELQESLNFPEYISGVANPKSSIGRLDVFTRLITDYSQEFEIIKNGYKGPIYAEISPRTFSILVRNGSKLSQLRMKVGKPELSDKELKNISLANNLVWLDDNIPNIKDGIGLSVNLKSFGKSNLIGWRAKINAGMIDIDKSESKHTYEYWDKLTTKDLSSGGLILNPDQFYILASKEFVCVPSNYAAEMRAYDIRVGEFRAHYAGFFDPGFGILKIKTTPTRAVLEVRSHDVPFLLDDGQIVCRLIYEKMLKEPENLYGSRSYNSNYQSQGLKLAKHFY